MLKKVLKKDFQATARTFLPLILGFVLVSILAKILFEIGSMSSPVNNYSDTHEIMTIFSILFFSLYVIYIIAYYILTYVFIVSDFYKTMVSEQGYLTHTLPVKTSTLINSKLMVSIFWQFMTGLLVTLSILLFFIGHLSFEDWNLFMISFQQILGMSLQEYSIYLIICMIIGAFSSPLMFYASISIGHLFGKHKVMGAILSYFGIYTVMQIISTVAMVAFGYSFSGAIRGTGSSVEFFGSWFRLTMWFAIIFSIITSVVFYIITNYVMSKKLNLE